MSTHQMQAGDRPGNPLYSASIGRIRLAGTVMGVIGLEVESGSAGVEDLAKVCGWPAWSFGPGVLNVDREWVAVLNSQERSLRAIVHCPEDGDVDLVLFQARSAVELPAATWDALEEVGSVLLCGVLKGDPNTANLQAATAAGELHAIVADVAIPSIQ